MLAAWPWPGAVPPLLDVKDHRLLCGDFDLASSVVVPLVVMSWLPFVVGFCWHLLLVSLVQMLTVPIHWHPGIPPNCQSLQWRPDMLLNSQSFPGIPASSSLSVFTLASCRLRYC